MGQGGDGEGDGGVGEGVRHPDCHVGAVGCRPGPGGEQEEDAVEADAEGEEDRHHVDRLPAEAEVHGEAEAAEHRHHDGDKARHPEQGFGGDTV